MEVNHRKIDIDQYDEDVLVESELCEPDPRDPAEVLNDTKQKAAAVRGSLSKYAIHSYILSVETTLRKHLATEETYPAR